MLPRTRSLDDAPRGWAAPWGSPSGLAAPVAWRRVKSCGIVSVAIIYFATTDGIQRDETN